MEMIMKSGFFAEIEMANNADTIVIVQPFI